MRARTLLVALTVTLIGSAAVVAADPMQHVDRIVMIAGAAVPHAHGIHLDPIWNAPPADTAPDRLLAGWVFAPVIG